MEKKKYTQQNPNIKSFEYGKMPPQATEIEDVILGALMIEKDLLDKIPDITMEMFYKESNKKIFKAIFDLHMNKSSIDILTVTEKLRSTGELDECGGAGYITNLTSKIASGAHFDYHLHIVKQKYIQREIIRITSEAQQRAYNDDDETIQECETLITDLMNFMVDQTTGNLVGSTLIKITNESIDLAAKRKIIREEGKEVGISIPIGKLQDITGGWQKEDLVLIAARPSMGKTAVAVKFAKHTAKRGYKTLFFSMEMSKIALNDRAILGETDINPEKWRNGEIENNDIEYIFNDVRSLISSWPLIIYDKPALRPEQIHSICKKEKPDIVFIDYIQLMRKNIGERFDRKDLEVGHISSELKSIAKEFQIPVIALSQLNRAMDTRGSKIPTLSDLRESGALEQDADIVMFPHRPYYYSKMDEDQGKIEFVIAKHRNGRAGIIEAKHNEYMNDFFDSGNEPIEIPVNYDF